MKKFLFALLLPVLTWTSGAAQAAVVDWIAELAPSNEVPPVVWSQGAGLGMGTINTVSYELTWSISYSGLGPVQGMHFHFGPVGVNGPVKVNIGDISGLGSPSIGSAFVGATDVDQILAGDWYINVHTAAEPGGEIRGQVITSPVPLPATSLLLVGALGLMAVGRSRILRRATAH